MVGCKYFYKNLNFAPGTGVRVQLTHQVMFIHLKTPFGVFHTSNYPLDPEIEKHRKNLGLVKFSTFEKNDFPLLPCRACAPVPNHLVNYLDMKTQLLE